jgi:hypothetical protein
MTVMMMIVVEMMMALLVMKMESKMATTVRMYSKWMAKLKMVRLAGISLLINKYDSGDDYEGSEDYMEECREYEDVSEKPRTRQRRRINAIGGADKDQAGGESGTLLTVRWG